MHLIVLFSEVVHASQLKQPSTDSEITKLIGKWLRGSVDRQGGRKSRVKTIPNGDQPADPEAENSVSGK